MNLYQQLQTARTEEDVKDAYIKAIGLKSYTKGLVDMLMRGGYNRGPSCDNFENHSNYVR